MPIINGLFEPLWNGINGPLWAASGEVLVTPVSLARYLDDTHVIFQDLRGVFLDPKGKPLPACLAVMDLTTRQITKIDNLGANVIVAGGGVWAAFFGGNYRDSFGTPGKTWYPLDVDPVTRRVLVSPGFGAGLARWDDTTLETLSPAVVSPMHGAADSGIAVAAFGAALRTFPDQAWPPFTQIINYAFRDGYLAGWHLALNGLVLWKAGPSTQGVLLLQHQTAYDVDLTVSSAQVEVVGSSGAGELPGENQTWVYDPVAQTVNGAPARVVDLLHGVALPPEVEPPVPAPQPIPVPQPPDPPAETDPEMKAPIMLPEGSPELAQFRADEGRAFDKMYGRLLNATNGVAECSEVNSQLRQRGQMDGDRAMLQPLMLENAMRKRDDPPTSDQMIASIDASIAAWRRLRGY